LLPNENVEWTTRKGFFNFSLILALLGTIFGIVLAAFGFLGGESNGQPFSPNPVLGVAGVVLLLVALGYAAFSYSASKATSYVLTNQRILETKSGQIVKEIALADFMGKPISQFLDKENTGTVNGQAVYNVRVTNPRTIDLIEFKSLNQTAVAALDRLLERAQEVVRCQYCNTNNSAASFVCSRCGAPLP
jgi:DNA-directed RNA polymerase subunit RPC12/RpoP